MKVLFISAFDSMNYAYPILIGELERRGHETTVIVRDGFDKINNKMYEQSGIDTVGIKEFDFSELEKTDLVVCSPTLFMEYRKLYKEIRERNIFMVGFSALFSSILMRNNPDVVLTLGQAKFKEFKDNGLMYNCVAIGNPQYDTLIENRRPVNKEISRVLVIDQGGYPYGAEGKRQLANTLIAIADNNPNMEFTIKPRYVKKEKGKGQVTHRVSEQLSDYIHTYPANLKVIEEACVLEDILPSFHAMITTWSTAYLDAMLLNLPLIIIDGLDSIDVFDVRKGRVQEAYDHLRGTGCVQHYQELCKGPLAFHYVKDCYQETEVYHYKEPSRGRIVDFFEFIKENLIDPGLRWKEKLNCTEAEFYDRFSQLELETVTSEDYELKRECASALNNFMQEAVYVNRCMGNVLDFSALTALYKEEIPETIELGDVRKWIRQMAATKLEESRNQFFQSTESMKLIENDKILQDFYFEWLYKKGQFQLIEKPEITLLVPESREYYLARINLDKKKRQAFRHLFSFLECLFEKDNVVELLKEKRLAQSLIPFTKGINKLYLFYYLVKTKDYQIFEYLNENGVTSSPAMTYFRLKNLNDTGKYMECVAVYERYYGKYSLRKRTIKRRLMNWIVTTQHKKAIKEIKKRSV